jgi:hypothetical protein
MQSDVIAKRKLFKEKSTSTNAPTQKCPSSIKPSTHTCSPAKFPRSSRSTSTSQPTSIPRSGPTATNPTSETTLLTDTVSRKLDGCHTKLLHFALNYKWSDYALNSILYIMV